MGSNYTVSCVYCTHEDVTIVYHVLGGNNNKPSFEDAANIKEWQNLVWGKDMEMMQKQLPQPNILWEGKAVTNDLYYIIL